MEIHRLGISSLVSFDNIVVTIPFYARVRSDTNEDNGEELTAVTSSDSSAKILFYFMRALFLFFVFKTGNN